MSDRLKEYKIAVLISGGGTNLQSLIDASEAGSIRSKIKLVLSSDPKAYGLERAKKSGIENFFSRDEEEMITMMDHRGIDLIVLAGYLKVIGPKLLERYPDRIINIHPSLLPKFGGMGMYGMNVHEAVFAAGEKTSGATVHFVNSVVDGGKILIQKETDISDCSTPKEIRQRVLELEHKILVEAIKIMEEV
ncbi:MAG: phosphoribosylglycinamide formyltransferase [Peptostreptococcaceae bacterium]|nr:phosphoribosylglycinamide formyltransferase [Peptostreptococcaceae bacterium]